MPYYITQKVMEAIEELIGPNTPSNVERLKMAVLKARQGASPNNRDTMSADTLQHFKALESEEEFYALREAFIGYILESQRDVGRRAVQR